MNENTEKKEKTKFHALMVILRPILGAIYPKELIRVNKGLIKAFEITKNDYFRRQAWRNRVWIIIAMSPLFVASYVAAQIIRYDEFISPWLSATVARIANMEVELSENGILSLLPPVEAQKYFIYSCLLMAIFVTISTLLAQAIRRTNPLVKETVRLEKLLRSNGIVDQETERLDFIMNCPAGILARVDVPPNDLKKNEAFWKKIRRTPSEVLTDKDDDRICFVGNGFALKNAYTYKL